MKFMIRQKMAFLILNRRLGLPADTVWPGAHYVCAANTPFNYDIRYPPCLMPIKVLSHRRWK